MSRLEELLGRVSIVLLGPKYPENIGSAARAAHNMGVERLVVVGKPLSDPEPALKTATHNAAHLVEGVPLVWHPGRGPGRVYPGGRHHGPAGTAAHAGRNPLANSRTDPADP